MPLSYALASERAQSAMYNVSVRVHCTECDARIPCRVHGTDVNVGVCPNACAFDVADVTDVALALAAAERAEYATHLQEQS